MALNFKKSDGIGHLAQSYYEEVPEFENQGPEILLLITELFMSTVKVPFC